MKSRQDVDDSGQGENGNFEEQNTIKAPLLMSISRSKRSRQKYVPIQRNRPQAAECNDAVTAMAGTILMRTILDGQDSEEQGDFVPFGSAQS